MHRDTGEWRYGEGISHSALSKEVPRGWRCLFIIGVGVGKILGCEEFRPNFPKLARKLFCATFAYKFSRTKIMNTSFWCNLQKKVFMCFYANRGCHFLKSNNVGRYFHPDFQGFCPDFQQIKTFGGALATPAPPPPAPLLFITVSWVISWVMKMDLKQIHCSYSGTQQIQNDFLSFLLLFLRSTLLMNRNNIIGNDLFCKFPLPSSLFVLPFPYRTVGRKFSIGGLYVCSGWLDILKLDKNSTDSQCFIIQFDGS